MPTPVQAIAAFAAAVRESPPPPPVVADAKLRLLDCVGLCLCVHGNDDTRRLVAEARGWGDSGHSTMIGFGATSAATAALVNGNLGHAEDYDDTHTESVAHVSAAVVPAALAVAEEQGASGGALLAAIAAGSEVAIRVGLGAQGRFHARGYHTTGIVGPFGAAVASAMLMRLEAAGVANAVGIVASMAAGIFEFLSEGATVKRVHPGWAAPAGIMAARLARGGVTGPMSALEGRQGFFRAHVGDEFDAARVVAGLGERWHAPDSAFKPYPCCNYLHAPLDCIAALRAGHRFEPEDVEALECLVPGGAIAIVAEPRAQKLDPRNGYDAKFSVPYTLAAMLVDGRIDVASYAAGRLRDARIRALMPRIAARADPDSDPYPTSFGGAVEIRLSDGRRLAHRERFNRGGPGRPMSRADVLAKFSDNARAALGPDGAQRVAQALLAADGLADVRTLSPLLAATRSDS